MLKAYLAAKDQANAILGEFVTPKIVFCASRSLGREMKNVILFQIERLTSLELT
jgi:hypothetical protein